ncbi:putative xyloglucan endotransglucosylase/hydrolase protein 10 [Canna indica]|uniref:Xyloglucan endotransglucosylase/hydrolase n=1 Tax=Canna indica TaxID=4628 RepID=A0AAQ3JZJ2_9LILI|nr:putative xyloglucan endotransglucosylase/hydrolase protein 10 [Canna indica]
MVFYARRGALFFVLFLPAYVVSTAVASVVSTGNFYADFHTTWSPTHVHHLLPTTCSYSEKSACKSNSYRDTRPAPFSPAMSLTSDRPNRDEIDLEFLGNVTGQPYILQTNVYANGLGDREERIYLWFDPTKDYHTYSILWNLHQIVFMVDWVPIRVYRNHGDKGVGFPRWQPMSLKASLWDGDSWATRGGLEKVDWSKGPFVVSLGDYKIDACVWKGNPRFCRADSSTNWWNKPRLASLTATQRRLFKWARKYYLVYDYCQDSKRFQDQQLPKECSLPKY